MVSRWHWPTQFETAPMRLAFGFLVSSAVLVSRAVAGVRRPRFMGLYDSVYLNYTYYINILEDAYGC